MTGIAGKLPVEKGILVTAPMTGIVGKLPLEKGILVTASNPIRADTNRSTEQRQRVHTILNEAHTLYVNDTLLQTTIQRYTIDTSSYLPDTCKFDFDFVFKQDHSL